MNNQVADPAADYIGDPAMTLREALEEIRRLNTIIAGDAEGASEGEAEIDRLTERAEKLRKDNVRLSEGFGEFAARLHVAQQGHHITPEMIAAAVEYANEIYDSQDPGYGFAWGSLNELNFFRCRGCGGSGFSTRPPTGAAHMASTQCSACAPWGSHGYTIGKRDAY